MLGSGQPGQGQGGGGGGAALPEAVVELRCPGCEVLDGKGKRRAESAHCSRTQPAGAEPDPKWPAHGPGSSAGGGGDEVLSLFESKAVVVPLGEHGPSAAPGIRMPAAAEHLASRAMPPLRKARVALLTSTSKPVAAFS